MAENNVGAADDDFTPIDPATTAAPSTGEPLTFTVSPDDDFTPVSPGSSAEWNGWGAPPADYQPDWFDNLSAHLGAAPGAGIRLTRGMDALARTAASGVSLGLIDKVSALGSSLANGSNYGENLTKEVEADKEAMATVDRGGGGQTVAGVGLGDAVKFGSALLPASKIGALAQEGSALLAPIGEKLAQYFAAGATGATVSGAQAYDDNPEGGASIGQKVVQALPAAIGGAAGGMLFHGIGEGLTKAWNAKYAADYNTNYGKVLPGDAADKLNEALKTTSLDPSGVTSVLQGLGPNSRLIDANGTLTAMGKNIAARTGGNPEAATTLVDGLAQREAQFHGELMDSLNKNAGPDSNNTQFVDDLVTKQQKQDDLNYGAARQQAQPVDMRPVIAKIDSMTSGAAQAGTEAGDIDGLLGWAKGLINGDNPSALPFDVAERATQELNTRISSLTGAPKMMLQKVLNSISSKDPNVPGAMDTSNPLYAYARQQSADARSITDAAVAGRNVFQPTLDGMPFDADAQAKLLGPMSPTERTAYAQSAIKALYDKFANGPTDASGTAPIFHVGSPQFNKIAQIIGVPQTQSIADTLANQAAMTKTGNAVRSAYGAGQAAAAKEINPTVETKRVPELITEPGAMGQFSETENIKNVGEAPAASAGAFGLKFAGALLKAWRANSQSAEQKLIDRHIATALVAHPTSPEVAALGARGDVAEKTAAMRALATKLVTPLGAALPGVVVGPSNALGSEGETRKPE